ncbi:MAG: transglycosylase family protein [Acidimicrobiales bacterium]
MSVLFVATPLSVAINARPAVADQVSDLKSQAAQIAQDLVLEQLQIGAYQQQQGLDRLKVQQDEAQIGSTESQISSDVSRVNRDRKRLQVEAVSAYVNMVPQSDGGQTMFAGNLSEAFARTEYEEVTSGDTSLAIDVLRTDENGLQAERGALEQQQAQDRAATNEETTQANAASQKQVELASKQSEITGALAIAVTQQQAAQAAAAAQAVRAAQAAAATAAAAASVASASPPSSGNPTSTSQSAPSATATSDPASTSGDPALPPFLQCVLRVESGGNYGAVSPGGSYMGGFQFSQPTWNEAAQLAGMPQLINVPPNEASPADQDDLAIALYNADGQQPWDDSCRKG